MTDGTVGIRLEPLDTLFFRDGRPFDAANRVESLLPSPQPLAGALRTALLARQGFDFHAFAQLRAQHPALPPGRLVDLLQQCLPAEGHWSFQSSFRGPWIALQTMVNGRESIEPLLPTPRNLRRSKSLVQKQGSWHRLDPLQLAEGTVVPSWLGVGPDRESCLLPLWPARDAMAGANGGKAGYPGGFVTLSGIVKFLGGGCPDDDDWFPPQDLFDLDHRIGIGIDPASLTTAEGQLYGIHLLALRPQAIRDGAPTQARPCLYAEMVPGKPDGDVRGLLDAQPIPFGGEGRYVTASVLPTRAEWPPLRPTNERSLWLLASPGIFGGEAGGHWRPNAVDRVNLKAAASGPTTAVSGWDIAMRGPKPVRFAVPAGSVYFVEGPIDTGPSQSLCHGPYGDPKEQPEHLAQGWGFALQGAWK